MEKRNIVFPCRESNGDSSVVQRVACLTTCTMSNCHNDLHNRNRQRMFFPAAVITTMPLLRCSTTMSKHCAKKKNAMLWSFLNQLIVNAHENTQIYKVLPYTRCAGDEPEKSQSIWNYWLVNCTGIRAFSEYCWHASFDGCVGGLFTQPTGDRPADQSSQVGLYTSPVTWLHSRQSNNHFSLLSYRNIQRTDVAPRTQQLYSKRSVASRNVRKSELS